jgi:hypothetical protein
MHPSKACVFFGRLIRLLLDSMGFPEDLEDYTAVPNPGLLVLLTTGLVLAIFAISYIIYGLFNMIIRLCLKKK